MPALSKLVLVAFCALGVQAYAVLPRAEETYVGMFESSTKCATACAPYGKEYDTCTADESISVEDLNRCACNSKLRAGFIACAKCIDDPAIPALVSDFNAMCDNARQQYGVSDWKNVTLGASESDPSSGASTSSSTSTTGGVSPTATNPPASTPTGGAAKELGVSFAAVAIAAALAFVV